MNRLISIEPRSAVCCRPHPPRAPASLAAAGVRRRVAASAGFTLIELMVVVAIIAVLTAIALPAYTNYITKTHRVAAEGCLSEGANYMERYYTTNLSYKSSAAVVNTLPQFDCRSTQQTGSYYQYDFPAGSLSVSSYQIEAVPLGSQLTNDTKCGTLTLDQTGKRLVSGTGAVSECW